MSAVPVLRLDAAETVVVVVDVQDKLLRLVPQAKNVLMNIEFVLDAAKVLNVPAVGTEQYPKGLGKTAASIAERLPQPIAEKTAFTCFGATQFGDQLLKLGRPTLLVVGIETHVCVMQTVLDLLERGLQVAVAVDAVAARATVDHDMALRRLERAGALLTTVETVVFEWLGGSARPEFKAISQMIQERTRRINDLAGRNQ